MSAPGGMTLGQKLAVAIIAGVAVAVVGTLIQHHLPRYLNARRAARAAVRTTTLKA